KHHYGDLIHENMSTGEMETIINKQNVTVSSASLKDTGIYECHAVVKGIASEPDKLQLNILGNLKLNAPPANSDVQPSLSSGWNAESFVTSAYSACDVQPYVPSGLNAGSSVPPACNTIPYILILVLARLF
ncbi:unnamed protein product, partial [Meganyctiphanes norvegica]